MTTPDAVPPAVPVEDALEQKQPAAPAEQVLDRDLPLEADEADTAEQSVEVPLDEDEGRT